MKAIYFILLSFCIILFSCKDDYSFCTETRTVQFSSYFYKKVGNQEITTNAPDLKIIDLSTSQTIFSNQPNISSFSLVLNPLKDSMRFYISLAPQFQADTLTVVYSTTNKALSPECGVISIHQISKTYTTKHTLDTVKLTNAAVTNDLLPNTKIIF